MGLSFASLWGVISFSICGMSYPRDGHAPNVAGTVVSFSPCGIISLLYVNCALDGYPLMNAAPYVVGLILFAMLPLFAIAPLEEDVAGCSLYSLTT